MAYDRFPNLILIALRNEVAELTVELPHQSSKRHLRQFALAYLVAAFVGALPLATYFALLAVLDAAVSGPMGLILGFLNLLLALTVGAAVFILPAMLVGYPLAVWVARYYSAGLTMLFGPLVGSTVGTTARIGFDLI